MEYISKQDKVERIKDYKGFTIDKISNQYNEFLKYKLESPLISVYITKEMLNFEDIIDRIVDFQIKPTDNHKCSRAGGNNTPIVTNVYFGHGDSSHSTYVECKICKRKSKSFGNYGFFENSNLRLAQEDWNENNDNIQTDKNM